MTRIAHKLDVLRAEQLSLKEEVEANEELGAGVRDVVHRTAKVLLKLHIFSLLKTKVARLCILSTTNLTCH